jgi:AcrR family transcriptional regulator
MAVLSSTAAARQNFIDVFCALYKTMPVEKITVTELARKAGYNRGTFYEYFSGVYDLLEQLEDELIDLIGKCVADTLEGGNFPGIVPVAFMETRKRAGGRAFALLEGGRDSRFPAKLKRSLMPVIMAAFHIPPGNTQIVYALDFYLSGIISLMTE